MTNPTTPQEPTVASEDLQEVLASIIPQGGGYFLVTSAFLQTMLNLPKDINVIGVEWDFHACALRLHVRGPGLPVVPDGEKAQALFPLVSINYKDGQPPEISWDFDAPGRGGLCIS